MSDFKVGNSTATEMNNYPNLDVEEANIQEAIAQFYVFFGRMVQLRNDIELLALDDITKNRILDQLGDIEKEYKDSQEWFVTRNVQDVRVGVVGTKNSLKSAVVSLFVEGVLEIEEDEKDGRSKSKITVDGKCKLLLIREETGGPSKQLCQWADVLLLVFSYADDDSLAQIADFYRVFRETSSEAPVMLVGIKDDQVPMRRAVKEGDVRKTVELLDKCTAIDVALSQQSTYTLFSQACRLALSSPCSSNFLSVSSPMNQCPLPSTFPSSPSQSSLSQPTKFSGGVPASPSHGKARSSKRKSMFGGSSKYNLAKSALESFFGSGRPVPVKEGHINKKSAGGLRAEWKKKYLVLSKTDLTYYPSLNDYMTMSHGKTLKLQQITVKVPGQHASSVSRTTTTPTNSELTESLTVTSSSQPGNASDRSNSASPPPGLESSLDMSYNSNSGLSSLPANFPPRITHTSPQHPPPLHQAYQDYHGNRQLGHEIRDYRSPASSERDEFGSLDPIEDSSSYSGSAGGHYLYTNGRGHNRNGSVDDTIMLQQLRTAGISYIPTMIEEDRSATMSRIETRKNKKGSIHVLPASSEEMLEGSQENIGRFDRDKRNKKGEKERFSMLLSERTQSESAKDRSSFDKRGGKGHKRQRSWGGNKLLEVEGAAVAESPAECCEFQVFSSDNKVWSFEASSAEEASLWVKAIEDQIKKIISESVSHKRVDSVVTDFEKKEIVNMSGNGFCADCNAPNPEWGSLNHGCLLCIECSGVHRNLGSHISRVRSLQLDEWSPELISVMLKIGNKVSRNLWEAKKPKLRPQHNASREEREKFIKAKYIDKEFLADLPRSDKPLPEQLMDAVKTNNIVGCLNILAHSTPEDINTLIEQPEGWTPMHVACMFGKTVILQLLIWNGGDVNILDGDKRTPIYYARRHGHQEAVQILIANSCVDDSSDSGSIDAAQQS